jgi:hypothetical protein
MWTTTNFRLHPPSRRHCIEVKSETGRFWHLDSQQDAMPCCQQWLKLALATLYGADKNNPATSPRTNEKDGSQPKMLVWLGAKMEALSWR